MYSGPSGNGADPRNNNGDLCPEKHSPQGSKDTVQDPKSSQASGRGLGAWRIKNPCSGKRFVLIIIIPIKSAYKWCHIPTNDRNSDDYLILKVWFSFSFSKRNFGDTYSGKHNWSTYSLRRCYLTHKKIRFSAYLMPFFLLVEYIIT